MRVNSKTLNTKPPEEWRRDVMRLPVASRWQVASVVWWDFFSQRESGTRWGHLDSIVNTRADRVLLSDEDLLRGLLACGYPKLRAFNRVHGVGKLKRYAAVQADALAALRAGEHYDSVADRLGVSSHMTWSWAKRAGLTAGKQAHIKASTRKKIVEMLRGGKRPAQVAKVFSLDPSTVSKIGRGAGLSFGSGRPRKESRLIMKTLPDGTPRRRA